MFDFTATPEGPRDRDSLFKPIPITAECFQPPQISYPRAWHRVPVAPVPGQRRQPKIWKRVGGLVAAPTENSLAGVTAELEQQGQGPRKRTRPARHVPRYSDALWDPRVEERQDGKRDLDEARAAVSSAKQAKLTSDNTTSRPATFPEETLKWVPRKRHNTRWPIEPKKEETVRMVADMQPLIEFEVPTTLEPVEATLHIDGKQMMKRSTRRLSRRFSLLPGEDSPRKLHAIHLSPMKRSAPMLSPVKRPLITLSPTKVVDSPRRAFRINATPTKVVLESPKNSPPAKSPSKPFSPPIPPTEGATFTPITKAAQRDPFDTPTSAIPLLFDQPTPEVPEESQHEARRRLSLQAARRIERCTSGVSRLLALKSESSSCDRRHSFASLEEPLAGGGGHAKGRRNTMDGLCVGILVEGPKAEEVLEIDMKTNLDIFGQPDKTVKLAQQNRLDEETDEATPSSESSASSNEVNSVAEESSASPEVTLSSPPVDEYVASEGAGIERRDAGPRQAVTGFDVTQAATEEHDLSKDSPPAFEETSIFGEEEESEVMFVAHDPEGLSTIYEESSIVENQSPDEVNSNQQAANLPSSAGEEVALKEMQPVKSVPDTSASHVVSLSDALSRSDSPPCDTAHSVNNDPRLSVETKSVNKTPVGSEQTTPPTLAVTDAEECAGFTPINGRQVSPPSVTPTKLQDEEMEAVPEPDDLNADEIVEEDLPADAEGDVAPAIDGDDLTINPPLPVNDTIQLQSRHDDSETEMLRNFVTRVTADKNAKAAAAAAALASKIARAHRRSSASGSPTAAPEPESRKPLGEKSPNSSPAKSKKRKLDLCDDKNDDITNDQNTFSPDAPRLKRRRSKRADPASPNQSQLQPSPPPSTATTTSTTAPAAQPAPAFPARPAPSANSIALSLIPVCLPGGGSINSTATTTTDSDPTAPTSRNQRLTEKDLATLTRPTRARTRAGLRSRRRCWLDSKRRRVAGWQDEIAEAEVMPEGGEGGGGRCGEDDEEDSVVEVAHFAAYAGEEDQREACHGGESGSCEGYACYWTEDEGKGIAKAGVCSCAGGYALTFC
ncbi:hypothetical protein N0V88_006222 [Collariella sp. IMI 366227]|nr:hypothetical protein N0V88_006222 [Collariella sp. IMI 366227]